MLIALTSEMSLGWIESRVGGVDNENWVEPEEGLLKLGPVDERMGDICEACWDK